MKKHFCAFQSLNICSFSFRNTPGIEVVCSQKPVEKLALQVEHTRPSPSVLQCEQKGTAGGQGS